MKFNPDLPASTAPAPANPAPEQTIRLARLAVALACLTFVVFLPVLECGWLNYDDDLFVTNNRNVAPGLTWSGVKWAFTSADIDYWRPLSWLSHMVDTELFGPVAGGHHLVNLLIHCAGVLMAMLALHRLTGQLWPSVIVAALFGLHPLHVESVAWIAERKDVLCGFFFWFTLWAYAAYVADPCPRTYLRVFAGFLLGIMSKPMVVTLPCVLLLLDFWPLRRLTLPGRGVESAGQPGLGQQLWPLVREKLPFFALVAVLCFSTVYSQHRVGTLADLSGVPFALRVQTSLVAYATYLTQMLVPANLCVLYPLERGAELWRWLAAASVMLLITTLCVWRMRRQPFLIVGWLWFVGMLVPVIGLVQVGEQAHADRYTYLPLNGLFLLLVWTATEWAMGVAGRQRLLMGTAVTVLLLCGAVTRNQLRFWVDELAAFGRALAVTQNNSTAHNNYGNALRSRGLTREALPYFAESARLRMHQTPLLNLGFGHLELGDYQRGLVYIRQAFAIDPYTSNAKDAHAGIVASAKDSSHPIFHKLLAVTQSVRGRYDEAAQHMEAAIKLDFKDTNAHVDRAAYLAIGGREAEAVQTLQRVLALAPNNVLAEANLAALLAKQGQVEEALKHYQKALAADPKNSGTRHNHALLLARSGRITEAKREFAEVLRMDPRFWPSMQQLAWLLATREDGRDGAMAVRLATAALDTSSVGMPALLDVLAAAHAANGDFTQAAKLAQQALSGINPGKDAALKAALQLRLEGYAQRRMHTEHTTPQRK